MRLALAGILYAYCFRPSDLLLADDPLLLRRHRAVDFTSPANGNYFEHTELQSHETGSFVTGSFVLLATVAGQSSIVDLKAGGGHGDTLASEQVGAIRLTDWAEFRAEDQRRMGLRLRAAREWIVEAAENAESRSLLAAETAGYLSPARRHDLLEGLELHAWKDVWSAVTLGDLNSLGERMEARLDQSSSSSPILAALSALSKDNDGARLNWLGPNMPAINGCMHPHLAAQMPYEEFERYMLPNRLAERASEFKLYVAEYLERAGIPPAFLAVIAEPAARRVFAGMKMADFRDWPAALSAFSKFDDTMMEGVLASQ